MTYMLVLAAEVEASECKEVNKQCGKKTHEQQHSTYHNCVWQTHH
jgi:hypothetical protein